MPKTPYQRQKQYSVFAPEIQVRQHWQKQKVRQVCWTRSCKHHFSSTPHHTTPWKKLRYLYQVYIYASVFGFRIWFESLYKSNNHCKTL